MNYRALVDGQHRYVCEFCYLWNPKGRQVHLGSMSTDMRQYVCGKGGTGALGENEVPEQREYINEPCLDKDWLVCHLNPYRKQ